MQDERDLEAEERDPSLLYNGLSLSAIHLIRYLSDPHFPTDVLSCPTLASVGATPALRPFFQTTQQKFLRIPKTLHEHNYDLNRDDWEATTSTLGDLIELYQSPDHVGSDSDDGDD